MHGVRESGERRSPHLRESALRERFEEHGQGHVFRFWSELDEAGRRRLLGQLAEIDLGLIERNRREATADSRPLPELETLEIECLPEFGGKPTRFEQARERGEDLLAAGRVAVLVVAGGQATRLGLDRPKGAYPLGPISGRTLFGLQAQKIRGLRRRFGCALPWYVMTSPATDAATRELFESSDHFGLPARDVVFFRQGTVPSLDFQGRLMLAARDRVFENPNGHGGSLAALHDSGALDDMEGRGVDTFFYYQVDNPLVRMADPVYLGFHDASGAEMSCKVIRKRVPGEKVGVLARAAGRPCVVEYTELDDEHRFARDDAGELVYWAGNAAIHVFSTAFVHRVAGDADRWLPYHASAKKIPCLDADGRALEPDEPNGYKFERFVFDALPAAAHVFALEARREHEYAPLKNAEGADSPATARAALVAEYRRWLEADGIALPPEGTPLEIDHARIDGPGDARALGIRSLADAGDAVLVGPGVEA